MKQLENTITQENIKTLMDTFYDAIRKDKDLGPIFHASIGTDAIAWENHKEKIARFWRQMILGENVFNGQPLKKHIELPPFPREFFDQWLKLFSVSLSQIYIPEVANEFLSKAQMIAQRFQIAMYDMQIQH